MIRGCGWIWILNKIRWEEKKKEKLKDITINTKLSKLCYVMEYYFIFIYCL